MPNETNLSIVRSISEIASARRAETARPESDGGRSRPETFGALVSETVHARNNDRKDAPPAEPPKEPVDPRPAPEPRRAAEPRTERARPRRSEAGEAHHNDDKAPATVAKTDKNDTPETKIDEASDETPACKDGCGEKKVEGEAGAEVGATADTTTSQPATTETAPTVPVAATDAVIIAAADASADSGAADPAPVGMTTDKTGGTMLPPAETPAAAAEAAVEAAGATTVAAAGAAKAGTVEAPATAETADGQTTESGASVDMTGSKGTTADLAARGLASKAAGDKEAAAKAAKELAAKEAAGKAEAGEGEGKTGTTAESGKKTTTPDLNPTRLSRVADMLDSFGLSHAIHRPADILAGLDRAVQASAMNGAANRATEIARPTPLQMLPIEIGMHAVRGVTNFQIRLDPAELGRVDVKLQIRDNGEVNASLVVDRVETLAMLKRDASTLQQAFEQAGLRQSADGLSFSLRGEGQNGEARRDQARGQATDAPDENLLPPQVAEMAMRRAYVPNSNLDLMI